MGKRPTFASSTFNQRDVVMTIPLGTMSYVFSEVANCSLHWQLRLSVTRGKTIKKNTNSTQNKSQTHRAKQYEVTSFLSTDYELSTETCS